MEIFSQEHFELIVRKSLPPGVVVSMGERWEELTANVIENF